MNRYELLNHAQKCDDLAFVARNKNNEIIFKGKFSDARFEMIEHRGGFITLDNLDVILNYPNYEVVTT